MCTEEFTFEVNVRYNAEYTILIGLQIVFNMEK
jgi:hypothetical protein